MTGTYTTSYGSGLAEDWQLLVDAGVPLGPGQVREANHSEDEVARAVRSVSNSLPKLKPVQREALYAFLRAWKHHWPQKFESLLGEIGVSTLHRLERDARDPNRYRKLRRIAISNLTKFL